MDEIESEIKTLTEEILEHNHRYYSLENPTISDSEYDNLLLKLKALEDQYPQWKLSFSPTQRVGGTVSTTFEKVPHRFPMLSLPNAFNQEDLLDFDQRIKKDLQVPENSTIEYFCEYKFDGISIELQYKHGIFDRAVTRGDGLFGEDVSPNVKTIHSIPLKFNPSACDHSLTDIRGEIVMTKKDFKELNLNRMAMELPLFANPRNAASGSLRQKDSSVTATRKLTAFFYALSNLKENKLETQSDLQKWLQHKGFSTYPFFRCCFGTDEVMSFYQEALQKRDDLPFEVDGIVIKVNRVSHQERLGYLSKIPRYAIAYKFPSTEARTVIKNIIHQVGRTGAVTPVAILDPVSVGGVVVSRATLHNYEEIQRKDIRIHDQVFVHRAGDVIPEVTKVITEFRTGNEIEVFPPVDCPSCGTKLHKSKDETILRCTQNSCPSKLLEQFEHFVSKDGMNIESLGGKYLALLVEHQLIKDAADIFSLSEQDFFSFPKMGEKLAHKLVTSIQASKNPSLTQYLFALGIRHVGKRTAEILARHFKNIENLKKADLETLTGIHEIGEKVGKSIFDYFHTSKHLDLLDKFEKAGVKVKEDTGEVNHKGIFAGKSFLFTGTLQSMSRSEASRKVREFGGDIVSSVTKNLDYLVTGEQPGSKLKKASLLGIKVITEDEFKQLLSHNSSVDPNEQLELFYQEREFSDEELKG